MSILNILSTNDLFYILKAQNLQSLKKRFPPCILQGLIALSYPNQQIVLPHKSQALQDTISDYLSYPLLLLWSIIGCLKTGVLSTLALGLLTGGMLSITGAIGIIYFIATYRELKNENQKSITAIHTATL